MTKDKTNLDKQEENNESFSGINENYSRGEHPKSQANLKPFPKGMSGNPLGRPLKFVKLAEALRKYSEKHEEYSIYGSSTYREEVLERIWYKAKEGDMQCIQLLATLGCLDGKD